MKFRRHPQNNGIGTKDWKKLHAIHGEREREKKKKKELNLIHEVW